MVIKFPASVENNFKGYSFLVLLYKDTKSCKADSIILDFAKTLRFEGNMVAVLGAILDNLEEKFNKVNIENISQEIRELFTRNNFLRSIDGRVAEDHLHTAVKYKKFIKSDGKSFSRYIDSDLLLMAVIPKMSLLLKKKISENIFEIFENAVIHGHCRNIFSCGQYNSKKNRLDFTIVDLGITIKKNVNKFLKERLSSEECIAWAAEEGNTTKSGAIPGGLGIGIIRKFLQLNGGKIQIISGKGYWEQKVKKITSKKIACNFPGTIVNLEFNIKDKKAYHLSSEVNKDDIF